MHIDIVHRRVAYILKGVLLLEAAFAAWKLEWQIAASALGILAITLLPLLLARRFRVYIPPVFELMAIVFVFATLFLGEIRGYYSRFWWWDIALHTSSGFLLGIVGFLLVHVLNETEHVELKMKPGFVAFFAFLFALGSGAVWEIFEFSMDQLFGTQMQKPMLGDPSGKTDTMWDLIVDALGALVISILGYGYLKRGQRESFLERWISAFVRSNPRLFGRDS